jgi:putative Mg2+ transporter-C (MgtC) family protein
MILRLGAAVLVGGLVGFERERRDRPAGLRTHMVVCLGSTLITLISIELAAGRYDPTRVAAQIVTGIGFLGAGTIFRSETGVRGLTTAAGLWVVAGMGMGIAAGGALMGMAALTGILVFVINQWLRVLEDRMSLAIREATLTLVRDSGAMIGVLEGLAKRGAQIERIGWLARAAAEDQAVVAVRIRLPRSETTGALTSWLSAQPGVREVEWD